MSVRAGPEENGFLDADRRVSDPMATLHALANHVRGEV